MKTNRRAASSIFHGSKKSRSRIVLLSMALTGLCVLTATAGGLLWNSSRSATAAAQMQDGVSPEALAQIEALIAEKESRTGVQTKMDSQLIYELKMSRGQAVADGVQTVETDLEYTNQGTLELDVKAEVTVSLISEMRANGAQIVNSTPAEGSVRIQVDIDHLEAIAALPGVAFIQPRQDAMLHRVERPQRDERKSRYDSLIGGSVVSDDPTSAQARNLSPGFSSRAAKVQDFIMSTMGGETNVSGSIPTNTGVGSRSSEGDLTHRAYTARGAFHVNGTGIKIGVLSDGVTNLAASQALGDLGPVTVLPGQTGTGDEGTAMLEIIHDLAPGAQLYFATAFTSITSFAQNIRDLRTAGCDIIVDDVFYFVETPFQDGAPGPTNTNGGAVTQAVNDVTAAGALYFSSAGNSGNLNDATAGVWEGDFSDGGPTAPPLAAGNRLHNFGGQNFNVLTLVSSSTTPISLYWADPLGGSSNDYDLFRLNAGGTAVQASSANIQNGTQDPYEQVAQGAAAGVRIVVVKKASAQPRFLHLNGNRGRLSLVTAGQTHGHSAAANAFGCAATPAVGPFPNPFNSTNVSETFTSDGPRRIFFQANGTPYTPGNFSSTGGIVRQKPDITAADGVLVTGVGGFPSPFFGTSAAAPHAAAIAGLLKSANPSFTPAQIRTALISTAIDIEAPGVDRDTGAGIINAFAAMQALGVPGTAFLEFASITASEDPGDGNGLIDAGDGANLLIELKNTGVANATAISAALTSSTPGVVIQLPNTSAYPDLVALTGSGTNLVPFRFTTSANMPCPTTLNFTLTVNYTGSTSPQVLNFSVPIGQFAISTVLDSTAAVEPGFVITTGLQTNRINRNSIISTCAAAKAFPGLVVDGGQRRYDAYTFTTCAGSSPSCITVTLVGTNAINLFTAAYLGSFNPANISQNYLADPGASAASRTYSFNLAGGAQTFVVVVHEVPPAGALGSTYTLTVSGACLNACAAPNQLPVAKCKNVTVPADANCVANASVDDGSFDPNGGPITITQSPAGPYAKGATPVLLTVRDPRGATAQCAATVTVVDATPPTITCPANIAVSNDLNQCIAIVSFPAPAVSDNCPGVGVPDCSPASGSAFPKGTTTVTCSVSDAAGNSSNCSFTVTVVDTTPPTITCPANITVGNDPGHCSAIVSFPAPAVSDNCPGVGTPACSPPSGSSFPKGTTTVTCSVSDAAGNSSNCSFTVKVNDVEPPVLTCNVTTTTMWPPNHNLINVGLSASVTDNCGGISVAVIGGGSVTVGVFSDEDDEAATGDGNFSPDAKNIGFGTLRLRSERNGDGDGRVYLIIVTATDSSGNVSRCCRTVTVTHDQSGASQASVAAQAAAASTYCQQHGTAPPGYFVVGDGPIVGPKQ